MVPFNELYILYTSLSCLIDVLKEPLFCHVFSYPETYVMNVGWRKETETHKIFKILETITLKIHTNKKIIFSHWVKI